MTGFCHVAAARSRSGAELLSENIEQFSRHRRRWPTKIRVGGTCCECPHGIEVAFGISRVSTRHRSSIRNKYRNSLEKSKHAINTSAATEYGRCPHCVRAALPVWISWPPALILLMLTTPLERTTTTSLSCTLHTTSLLLDYMMSYTPHGTPDGPPYPNEAAIVHLSFPPAFAQVQVDFNDGSSNTTSIELPGLNIWLRGMFAHYTRTAPASLL